MQKLDKSQIIILASIVGLVVLSIGLYFGLSGGNESVRTERRIAGTSSLPSVPKKEDRQFKGKLDAAKQNNSEREKELELDIFKENEEPEKESVRTKPEPTRSTTTVAKRSTSSKPEVKEEKEPVVEEEIDDFLLATSMNKTGQTSESEGSANENKKRTPGSLEIVAVVHDNQTVKHAQRVTVRVLETVEHGGKSIEAGRFLHTIASFNNGRVYLDFSAIRFDDGTPVGKDLSAFDATDHQLGLYSEQLSEQEFSGEAADEAMASRGYNPNQSLGSKLAEGLAKKKLKEVSIQLRDNTKIIIR